MLKVGIGNVLAEAENKREKDRARVAELELRVEECEGKLRSQLKEREVSEGDGGRVVCGCMDVNANRSDQVAGIGKGGREGVKVGSAEGDGERRQEEKSRDGRDVPWESEDDEKWEGVSTEGGDQGNT